MIYKSLGRKKKITPINRKVGQSENPNREVGQSENPNREVGRSENTNKSNNIFGQHEIFLKGHFLYRGGI